MNTALKYAQMVSMPLTRSQNDVIQIQALHIQPWDKAITYNIAMIQQKSAEMLFTISPAKRALKDLERVIEQAAHAQKFVELLSSCR